MPTKLINEYLINENIVPLGNNTFNPSCNTNNITIPNNTLIILFPVLPSVEKLTYFFSIYIPIINPK